MTEWSKTKKYNPAGPGYPEAGRYYVLREEAEEKIGALEAEVARLKAQSRALTTVLEGEREKLLAVGEKFEERPRHGFDRNSSHTEDRYVCDCGYDECYQADDAWADDLKALLK